MRFAIAITLIVSGIIFASGALGAVRAMQRGIPQQLAWPPLLGYFGMAFACLGEAGWLLSGQTL